MRCNANSIAGTAFVDGYNMTFGQFIYSELDYETVNLAGNPLDPIALLAESNLLAFQVSARFKILATKDMDRALSRVQAMEAAMWDGILAMSFELYRRSSRSAEKQGIQRLEATGIRRDTAVFPAFITLLSIWFTGMIAATVVLLRPAWTSTLDGYAVACMLQHQPVVSKTVKSWFSELEDNEDLQQRFKMRSWKSTESWS